MIRKTPARGSQMSFQFVHIESYGRANSKGGRTVGYVLDEAERKPGDAPHVEDPKPPTLVYGTSVGDLREAHDRACDEARSTLANGKTRRIRNDQHTLMTVIASHPATPEQYVSDPKIRAEVDEWQERTLGWMEERYGAQFTTALRHDDESHVHLHMYVLPTGDPELRAKRLDPGYMAKADYMANVAPDEFCLSDKAEKVKANKIGDRCYKEAMRGFQDEYWEKVGLPCGLTRIGPGKRRLTTEAHNAEKHVAKTTAIAIAVAGEATKKVNKINEAHARVVRAGNSVSERIQRLEQEQKALEKEKQQAQRRADKLIADAKAQAKVIIGHAQSKMAEAERVFTEAKTSVGHGVGKFFSTLKGGFIGTTALIKETEHVWFNKGVTSTKPEVEGLKAKINEKEEIIGGKNKHIRLLEDEKKELKDTVREKETNIVALSNKVTNTEKQVEDYRGRWANADNRLKALTTPSKVRGGPSVSR